MTVLGTVIDYQPAWLAMAVLTAAAALTAPDVAARFRAHRRRPFDWNRD